jgi:hypothetical protein
MFKYVLLAYMALPLIGLFLMERGAYSLALQVNGSPNGAFVAYLMHFLAFFVSYFLMVLSLKKFRYDYSYLNLSKYASHFDRNFIWFCLFSFVLVIFVFGGYKVILGVVDKSTFRVELQFGAILYLIVKSLLPAGLCYYALISSENNKFSKKFYVCCFLAAVTVLGLGFKLFVVTLFLPTMLVLLMRASFISISKLGVVVLCVLVFTTYIFDADNQYGMTIFEYLITRATVLTADIPWYIWGMSPSELETFPIKNTYISALGRTPLSFFGISNLEYYLDYSFGPLITTFVGRSQESVINGSTVTGTIFSTSLFVFGHKLFFLLSIFMGMLCGYFSMLLSKLKQHKKYKYCAILSTYMSFFVVGSINSGDMSKLFAYSSLMYIVICYLFLRLLDFKFFFKKV